MKLSHVAFVCGLLLASAWSAGLCGESRPTTAAPVLSGPKEPGGGALHVIRHVLAWRLALAVAVTVAVGCVA